MPTIPFKTTQKRSSVSGRCPDLCAILDGEIFLQLADGGFLFKNAAGNDYVCAITNCTINGLNKIKFSGASNLDIPYWNGSCFVPTGLSNFVNKSETGNFVITSQITGSGICINLTDYVQKSQTGSFVSAGQTGVFVLAANTGNFITTSQTGAFGGGGSIDTGNFVTCNQTGNFVLSSNTGNFITTSQTGSFASTGHIHLNYVSTGSTGNFVTCSQTGNFVTSNQTGSFVVNSNTGNFITSNQTGNFALNNHTHSEYISTGCQVFASFDPTITGSANYSVIIGGANAHLNTSTYSVVLGGSNHCIDLGSNYSLVAVGNQNCIPIFGCLSTIIGGSTNKIEYAKNSNIIGGSSNYINIGNYCNATILGGFQNLICCGDGSIIAAGCYNKISGIGAPVCSSFIAGLFSTISGSGLVGVSVFGNSITATCSNTLYANNICAYGNGKFYGDGSCLCNLATGNFITTGQTGAFGGGSLIDTGNFVTTSQTGAFAASAHTHSNYVSTGSTGNFVTTSQTGALISSIQLTGYISGTYSNGYINTYFKQYPNIKIVGVDYTTIQSAIDSVTDANTCKNYNILIPPGRYVENLTLKPLVNLIGINGDLNNLGVLICGCHSYTPTYSNILCNRITIDNVSFINPSGTPIFYINSSGYCSQIRFNGVYIEDNYTGINDTCSIYALSGATLYFNHSRLQTLNTNRGTALYLECATGAYLENQSCIIGGNRAIKMTGYVSSSVPYLQVIGSAIEANTITNNGETIRIDNGLATFGSSSISNSSTSGNGLFISSGAVVGVYNSTFKIAAYGAGYYAVNGHTGILGGNYFHTLNMYSCVAAAGILYNTKYKSGMNIFAYPTGITAQA